MVVNPLTFKWDMLYFRHKLYESIALAINKETAMRKIVSDDV